MDHSGPMDAYSQYRKQPHQEVQSLGIRGSLIRRDPSERQLVPRSKASLKSPNTTHKHKGHFYNCCTPPDTTWTA